MKRVCLATCLVLLLPLGAAAQTIDRDAAQTLRQSLQSWLGNLLGPDLGAKQQPLRVTAEADHFRVTLPFADATGDNEVNADVRPLDGGRWSIDALHLPSAARFTLDMPEAGRPNGETVPTDFALHIGSQNSHGLFDPALAAPSSLNVELGNIDLTTDSAKQHQEQHIDRYTMQASLQPHDGRLDLLQQGTITGWRTASRVGDNAAMAFGADRIQASGGVNGIDRDRGAALMSAVGGLIATLPPAAAAQHGNAALSAPERAALRALIESLGGIADGMHGEETIDGLHVAIAGRGEASARQMRLGFDGVAPAGMLRAKLTIALEGIAVKNMAPEAAALMPRRIVLRPSVSGLKVDELKALALAATNQDADHEQLQTDATALLSHGGVTVGLDTLELDVGPAALRGDGHVLLTDRDAYEARAHITATGLDELMKQAASNPNLQRALPLLAMARGFAKPEGNRLVWDIVAGKTGVTVNGVELGNPAADAPHPRKR